MWTTFLYKHRYIILLTSVLVYSTLVLALLYNVILGKSNKERQASCLPCPASCGQQVSAQPADPQSSTRAYQNSIGATVVKDTKASANKQVQSEQEKFPQQANASSYHVSLANGVQTTQSNTQLQSNITSDNPLPDTELEKIDWNDHELMAKESARKGLGENGRASRIPMSKAKRNISDELWAKYNFNAYLSDHISLERSIGDLRTPACKEQKFIKDIPQKSVSFISVFHNEKNSTLLRTIHAIINRSPPSLVREIILVDDLSTDAELKTPLDEYVAQHFTNVRVLRNQERLGLIKSRMRGADFSSGRFLVFLDAHIEVNYNYLPPLLEPMILNYKTIACPMVDSIMDRTLKVNPLVQRYRGVFDWYLTYKRLPMLNAKDETTPHASPVMVGCAFAITRRWWEELGKYDPGLEIWGAEQYEISFKSWMCGGSVVDAPCSRVAHLFRPLPYVKEVTGNNTIEKNYLRLADVWMDEFKEFILMRRPLMRTEQAGDISKQLELRKRLNCKPFKWYMEEIAPDILYYFPPIEPPYKAWGLLKSGFNTSLCITILNKLDLSLETCHRSHETEFVFDWRLHIRQASTRKCFANSGGEHIFMWECLDAETRATQNLVWNRQSGHIVTINTHRCIDVDTVSFRVYTAECNETSATQSWQFEAYNATMVDDTWNKHLTLN